jgi:large subunit ribosomal protein L27Ae
MRHFHLNKDKYFCPTINLDRLWTIVSEQTRLKYANIKDKAPIIDVTKAVRYNPLFI